MTDTNNSNKRIYFFRIECEKCAKDLQHGMGYPDESGFLVIPEPDASCDCSEEM